VAAAYETAARANELLALDIGDLDLANRRARVHSKGGAVEWVFWRTGSAQLLPRLLAGRTGGPGFLAGRRPTRAVAGLDLDPTSGRARLSYRRAAELFQARTGWTLHQLRHSALTTRPRRYQPAAAAGPVPARLGAVPGALCPPRAGGSRPPPRRDRPGTPAAVTTRTTSRGRPQRLYRRMVVALWCCERQP
jgi:integrase